MIGPYKLLEQIGEGGMGVVFMAEQQTPVRRKVAVKLIKPGMDTRQVIARFEAERQALAVMDHPNIARVLDAGATTSGRPYFVMELVRGVAITTYCDENSLSIQERLELFASVCQAIQHAHTKGIIHRDIKPTNVLITQQDTRPVVKVIDFGVAKAIGQQLTEQTLFTNFAQMIGTPLYMSPEQAEQSGVDIDTRSDIYSLGVLLYELLTGTTPVNAEQLNKAAFDEIRRIIREDDPPMPSARISGSQTLPAIAARRHVEPARLSRLVRGELDWIVMKALEKDRNRRYETASTFAADVMHYVHDEPILASPASVRYRLGKFAKRYRLAITSACLVAAALVAGTIVSVWQGVRAESARAAEAEQRQIAEHARAGEARQRRVADEQRIVAVKQRDLALQNLYVADINLAHQDWSVGNLTRMSRALRAHQPHDELPDVRGWEWYYLTSLLRKQKHIFHPQLGAINQVRWNPAGRLVAIAGDSGIKIYEPLSQQVVHFIAGRALVAWSSDGSRLVTAMTGQQTDAIKIWNTQNWHELLAVPGSDGPIHAITWRADGRALAWAGSKERGRFYIWEEGQPAPASFTAPAMNGPDPAHQRVAWGTEARSLAMGGAFPASLVIWDPLEQKMAKRLKADGRGLTHIAWNPDGKRVAAATIDGDIRLWNVESGQPPQSIAAHHGQIAECCWSADGKRLASGGEDNLVRIWNAETGQQLNRLPGHRAAVSSVDWTSREDWIVSGARDGTVGLWRPDESLGSITIPGRDAAAWSPDGSRIASNDPRHKDGETYSILDSHSGQTVKGLQPANQGSVHVFAWSPNGKMIAGAGFRGATSVWNATSGQLLHSIRNAHGPNENGVAETRCVAWSPDSRQFATCGLDRLVKIWDAATGRLLRTFADHANWLGSVCWSPDGKWFASADWGRRQDPSNGYLADLLGNRSGTGAGRRRRGGGLYDCVGPRLTAAGRGECIGTDRRVATRRAEERGKAVGR